MTKVLRTSLLGLGFLVSCGGSASRGHHDAQPPGVTACAVAASLCTEDQLELGPEECDPTTENIAQGSCSIELACGKPIFIDTPDPDSNARAWLMRFGSSSCYPAESGKSFTCGCS